MAETDQTDHDADHNDARDPSSNDGERDDFTERARAMAWWRKALIGALVIGIIVLIWHFFLRSDQEDQQGPQLPPPATVTIDQAVRAQWDSEVTATGTFAPVRGVEVTGELGGTIEEIFFTAGQYVRQGAPLVRLDTSTERAQVARLQAQLRQASAAAARALRLIERGAIAEAEVEQTVAERDALAAQIAEVRAVIGKKTIRAPFSGQLGIRLVELGQYLSPGTAIAQLVQPSPLYLNFELPEGRIGEVSVGQAVEARVSGFEDMVIGGSVTAINPDVATGTRNFTVQATIANSDGRIRPGQFAEVTLDTGSSRSVLTVPATAVVFNAYGSSVYLAEEPTEEQRRALAKQQQGGGQGGGSGGGGETGGGKAKGKAGQGAPPKPQYIAKRVFVETGERRGLDIAILEGLEPGQRVVVTGQVKLSDGTPLIPAPREPLEGVPAVPDR
ncbi:MAG: efflux RND transporter periplasmic adaptor subunit, partial [Erythrobacter sp.]|nr:efflux RND transporter periplasmic adaptor subunit [Erythrobacter sp.]